LYAFRRRYLLELAGLEPTARERTLGLEQLRALEHGCRIKVVETRYHCVGVDRPEDLKKAEQLLAAEKEASS
jgi:3-deoxy-manno-octulosonate cytidylyltransferase (CMP-KDO synthetase)